MAIKYFRKKDYKEIIFYRDNSFPKLSQIEVNDLKNYWQVRKAENPSIFNGEICCCHSFEDDNGRITLGLNKNDYATYSYIRGNDLVKPGGYASGNCLFVFDENRQSYIFLRRGNTAFDSTKISAVGGVLDYKETITMSNFLEYVKEETIKELLEELHIQSMPHNISFLGFYVDTDTYRLDFAYKCQATISNFSNEENVELIEVKKSELAQFYYDNRRNLELTTGVHLKYIKSDL